MSELKQLGIDAEEAQEILGSMVDELEEKAEDGRISLQDVADVFQVGLKGCARAADGTTAKLVFKAAALALGAADPLIPD